MLYLVFREVGHWEVDTLILLLAMKNVMSVREGTSLNILARESDMVSIHKKRTVTERLAHCPVSGLSARKTGSSLQDSLETSVKGDVCWWDRDGVGNALKSLHWNTSVGELLSNPCSLIVLEESLPWGVEPVSELEFSFSLGLGESILANLLVLSNEFLNVSIVDDALFLERVSVLVEDVLVLLDRLVHSWLGKHRLVDFVVTVSSVTDQIDDDVGVEGLSEFGGDLGDVDNSIWIVGVDVEDGGVDDSANVGTVRRGSRVSRISSETDLVVADKMDGATDGVEWKMAQVKSLVDDTLSSEGSVTVEKHWNDCFALKEDLIKRNIFYQLPHHHFCRTVRPCTCQQQWGRRLQDAMGWRRARR